MTLLRARVARAQRACRRHDAAPGSPDSSPGLTAAAAAVVAQAVLALARALCTDRDDADDRARRHDRGDRDRRRRFTGLHWLPIALGALAGRGFFAARPAKRSRSPRCRFASRAPSAIAGAAVFAAVAAVLMFGPTARRRRWRWSRRSCARGHARVRRRPRRAAAAARPRHATGLLASRDFFAGYGAVQAMPGPLFTFAVVRRRGELFAAARRPPVRSSRRSRSSSRRSRSIFALAPVVEPRPRAARRPRPRCAARTPASSACSAACSTTRSSPRC